MAHANFNFILMLLGAFKDKVKTTKVGYDTSLTGNKERFVKFKMKRSVRSQNILAPF